MLGTLLFDDAVRQSFLRNRCDWRDHFLKRELEAGIRVGVARRPPPSMAD